MGARDRFGIDELEYRWSTQDLSSVDRVPFVRPLRRGSDHLYVATGFSASGVTNATMSGLLLRDLILGVDNPSRSSPEPGRGGPPRPGRPARARPPRSAG